MGWLKAAKLIFDDCSSRQSSPRSINLSSHIRQIAKDILTKERPVGTNGHQMCTGSLQTLPEDLITAEFTPHRVPLSND